MSGQWDFQVRIGLDDERAALLRDGTPSPEIADLQAILKRHNALAKCQFDAFAEYVAEAEAGAGGEACGLDAYPLHAWTKATIEDPDKKAKYLKSFTLYVEGAEVYPGDIADPLEADLVPLQQRGDITALKKYDTNPDNNPQPPKDRQNG